MSESIGTLPYHCVKVHEGFEKDSNRCHPWSNHAQNYDEVAFVTPDCACHARLVRIDGERHCNGYAASGCDGDGFGRGALRRERISLRS